MTSVIVTDMKIRLSELRRMIHEEVDRFVRNSAGFIGGGVGQSTPNLNPIMASLGDEGNEDDVEEETKDERTSPKTQLAARVSDKQGGPWRK